MLAYRYLTGVDSADFSHSVTRALATGWSLYGDPSSAFDARAGVMCFGQAVVKEVDDEYDRTLKLDEL